MGNYNRFEKITKLRYGKEIKTMNQAKTTAFESPSIEAETIRDRVSIAN